MVYVQQVLPGRVQSSDILVSSFFDLHVGNLPDAGA